MSFGRRSLETLALPGAILADKYRQFRQRRHEASNRRVTERELSALHYKIDKLLNKLEESDPEPPTSQDDECVICIQARATMETLPCGHRVVCRRCFVKTIQSAVQARMLPLRCVICRARINRLTSGSGSWLPGSNSSYSMGSGSSRSWGVSGSASSFSMGQSSSLYSMSSGSASLMSGVSSVSSISGRSDPSAVRSVSAASCSSSTATSSHSHKSNCSCSTSGCQGAIPRNPSSSTISSLSIRNRAAMNKRSRSPAADTPKNVTNINYNLMYNNPSIDHLNSRTGTASPGVVVTETAVDTKTIVLRSRLPTIKESPVHTLNVKNRFCAYTGASSNDNERHKTGKSDTIEMVSMTTDSEINNNARVTIASSTNQEIQSKTIKTSSLSNDMRKVNKPKSRSRSSSSTSSAQTDINRNKVANPVPEKPNKDLFRIKTDNKKDDSSEKRRKEEKARIKAEKEAKKEEKRIAKEEEKLAKMLAKEEKKRLKREAKQTLLSSRK